MNAKKLHIKTWGCQMNMYDSARMADVVKPLGYEATDDAAEADLVILNTCHIREKATEKLFSELGRLKESKDRRKKITGRGTLIAVAGCVAQAQGEEIRARAPYVDMVFGPQTYHQLPEMIARVTRESGGVLNTDFPPEAKFDFLPENNANGEVSAFLAIQEGCDRFCSFCVVPYTRGAEYSRDVAEVVAEAKRMVESGAREIVLLGQNVNAWHGKDAGGKERGLSYLLEKLSDIGGLVRLRYTTSHPLGMDDALIAAHRDLPKLMPFLHLPAQSGSDRILEAMNRKHTSADYLRIVDKLRKARPDMALSTDIIVGFPNESDRDFEDTVRLVEQVGFAQAYSFAYSARHGTPAAAMAEQIRPETASARLSRLQEILRAQQAEFNAGFADKTVSVLVEKPARSAGRMFGRTPHMQTAVVDVSPDTAGKEINVKVKSATPDALICGVAD